MRVIKTLVPVYRGSYGPFYASPEDKAAKRNASHYPYVMLADPSEQDEPANFTARGGLDPQTLPLFVALECDVEMVSDRGKVKRRIYGVVGELEAAA